MIFFNLSSSGSAQHERSILSS